MVAIRSIARDDYRPPVEPNLPTDLVRASGIVALIWAYSGLILGLSIGIRPVVPVRAAPLRPRSGRSVVLALHRQVNAVVLALVLLHALVFAFAQPGGSLLVALVPLSLIHISEPTRR